MVERYESIVCRAHKICSYQSFVTKLLEPPNEAHKNPIRIKKKSFIMVVYQLPVLWDLNLISIGSLRFQKLNIWSSRFKFYFYLDPKIWTRRSLKLKLVSFYYYYFFFVEIVSNWFLSMKNIYIYMYISFKK